MKNTNHLSQEDLALFALQFLAGDELEAALDHLELCEDCRHDVAKYQGDLVGYALAQTELHSPPAAARERLMKRVAKEKKIVPIERPVVFEKPLERMAERPLGVVPPVERSSGSVPIASHVPEGELFLAARGRRIFEADAPEERKSRSGAANFLGWAGWAVAAGLAVTAGLQYHERQNLQSDLAAESAKLQQTNADMDVAQSALHTLTGAGAMQVSLHEPVNGHPEPPVPEGHAAYVKETGSLVFIANHMAPLQPDKTYELWLIPNKVDGVQAPPIPAGTFKPDTRGVAQVMMPELPKGVNAAAFAVTVEDEGGSKVPTSPIILMGM